MNMPRLAFSHTSKRTNYSLYPWDVIAEGKGLLVRDALQFKRVEQCIEQTFLRFYDSVVTF